MQGSSGSWPLAHFFVVEVKSEVIMFDSHSRLKNMLFVGYIVKVGYI